MKPFAKKLFTRLTVRSFCNLSIILVIYHFGFEGRTLVLIGSVPGHSLHLSFAFMVRINLRGMERVTIYVDLGSIQYEELDRYRD